MNKTDEMLMKDALARLSARSYEYSNLAMQVSFNLYVPPALALVNVAKLGEPLRRRLEPGHTSDLVLVRLAAAAELFGLVLKHLGVQYADRAPAPEVFLPEATKYYSVSDEELERRRPRPGADREAHAKQLAETCAQTASKLVAGLWALPVFQQNIARGELKTTLTSILLCLDLVEQLDRFDAAKEALARPPYPRQLDAYAYTTLNRLIEVPTDLQDSFPARVALLRGMIQAHRTVNPDNNLLHEPLPAEVAAEVTAAAAEAESVAEAESAAEAATKSTLVSEVRYV